jgi:hypothetical protein
VRALVLPLLNLSAELGQCHHRPTSWVFAKRLETAADRRHCRVWRLLSVVGADQLEVIDDDELKPLALRCHPALVAPTRALSLNKVAEPMSITLSGRSRIRSAARAISIPCGPATLPR